MSEEARILGLLITIFGGLILVLFVVGWVEFGLRESFFAIATTALAVVGILGVIIGLAWAWGLI